jgi:hypothetical protein
MQEQDGCASSTGGGSGDAFMEGKRLPSLLSFKGGRKGMVSKASPLTRWFETPVTLFAVHDLHAASSRQSWSRHVFAVSASSHGPLTACLTRAIGGPSSYWGPLILRSLERARLWARLPGATVGVLDTGVSRSTCAWATSTAQLWPRSAMKTEAQQGRPS